MTTNAGRTLRAELMAHEATAAIFLDVTASIAAIEAEKEAEVRARLAAEAEALYIDQSDGTYDLWQCPSCGWRWRHGPAKHARGCPLAAVIALIQPEGGPVAAGAFKAFDRAWHPKETCPYPAIEQARQHDADCPHRSTFCECGAEGFAEWADRLAPADTGLRNLALALSSNPKSRHHDEQSDNGWSAWACVPMVDAVQAADRLAPADTGRLRDTTCVMCGCYTADHRLVCDNGSCPCERAAPADTGLREAAQASLVCLIGQHRFVVSEWSGNFGGHVAIRDGWVEWDEETVIEECPVCEAIDALRAAIDAEAGR